MISRTESGGSFLQVLEMETFHAEGHLKCPYFNWTHTKVVHGSAHDMTVVHFQKAHPSRTVIQQRVWHERNPNSPDFKDLSAERTEYQVYQAPRKSVQTPQRVPLDKKLPRTCTTTFFAVCSYILAQTDRRWCFLAHDALSPQEKKIIRQTTHDLEIPTANGIVRSTIEAWDHVQELGNPEEAQS